MPEQKNGKKNIWPSFLFYFMRLGFKSPSCNVDTTVFSIIVVFFKKTAIMIATHGQKTLHWQLNKVLLSGMYNCNFEAIN